MALPTHVKYVVIGAGIHGLSSAWHLAENLRKTGKGTLYANAYLEVFTLEDKLRAAQVRYQGHRYLAQHGFANETAVGAGRIGVTQYDPVWAQRAYCKAR